MIIVFLQAWAALNISALSEQRHDQSRLTIVSILIAFASCQKRTEAGKLKNVSGKTSPVLSKI
jgi:hypothetical protein